MLDLSERILLRDKLRLSVIVDCKGWPDSALDLVLVNITKDSFQEDNSNGEGEQLEYFTFFTYLYYTVYSLYRY